MGGKEMKRGVAISSFAAVLLALSAQASQKVQYALRLAAGQSYDVRAISDSNVVQQGQGQEMRTEVSLGLGYRLDVNTVDPQGNMLVDCAVTWVKFRQKTPTGEVGYDSSQRGRPIPLDAMSFGPAALLDEHFSARITPQGQTREIRGLEAMRKDIEKKIPEGPTRAQVMQGLSEERLMALIREYFLRSLAVYPDKPVGIGDSWSRSDISEISSYDYDTTWTLKDRKAGIAFIDFETVMRSRPQRQPQGAALSGHSQGQIEIDESTGQILYSTTTQEMSGRMTVGSSPLDINAHSSATFQMSNRKAGPPR